MRYDADLLESVERGTEAPTLRFFRFKDPTVSFGRLQKFQDIESLVPRGWAAVQRPTGGGVVFHQGDFCLSLAWPTGHAPLPTRSQQQYRWIHSIILSVLSREKSIRMAACENLATPQEPFATRSCFQNPVGFDLLQNERKIVGGALRIRRGATLYQGSLQQSLPDPAVYDRLAAAFETNLSLT